jgi:aldose 1-epimerase
MMETYTLPAVENFTREMEGSLSSMYTIHSQDGSCACAVTNYGARIISLIVPDAAGKPTDVVLGYSSLEGYLSQPEDYMGAVVGRCANRIAAGLFVLNGETCILPVNDGPNTLHGGPQGFHKRVWQLKQAMPDMLAMTYCSAEGEEGFPGKAQIELNYQWTDSRTLSMRYRAVTDRPTLMNLSNHSYFNLSGEGTDTILDHQLTVDADAFTPVNDTLIPLGMLRDVTGTPFDFRNGRMIGDAIGAADEQLQIGRGYDHNFVLNHVSPTVLLRSPRTGIQMNIKTNQPGLQFYSGNFLDGSRYGKSGKPYRFRSAVALEPQGFPDAIHHPQFPSVVLKPGVIYHAVSEYRFDTT